MALVPGGLYTDEQIGVEGIRRGEHSPTAAAFNDDGSLRVCCVIRQDALNPYQDIRIQKEKITATSQLVYLYFYEFRGHSGIDAAKERSYAVLEGERLPNSYQIWWDYETAHFPDIGPVKHSTTLRQDWRIVSLRRPV
jgi:hypothetical protein